MGVRLKVVRSKTKSQIEALTESVDGAQYFASDTPNIYLGNGGVPTPYGTGDVATEIHAATTKNPPVDADEFGFWDSVSGLLRKLTWVNIKSTLEAYFNEIYTVKNTDITGATKTKITYDSKGLVTSGEDATTEDIAPSTDKNYVTDSEKVIIENTSGTNTGDQDLSGYQEKALTTGKIWKGVGGIATEVDPPSDGGGHIIKKSIDGATQVSLIQRDDLVIETSNAEDTVTDNDTQTVYTPTIKSMNDYDATGEAAGSLIAQNATNTGKEVVLVTTFDNLLNSAEENQNVNAQLSTILPAGYKIQTIRVTEDAGNVAGNISVGTTAAGTDIVNANEVIASDDIELTVVKGYWSSVNDTDLFISSSAWGTGVITIYFTFIKV